MATVAVQHFSEYHLFALPCCPPWTPALQIGHTFPDAWPCVVQVDRLAQSLMPANLKPLRQMLHATAVEVLLYLTPLHCQDMLDSVVLSLNTVHAKFMQRNPRLRRAPFGLLSACGLLVNCKVFCQVTRWFQSMAKFTQPAGQDFGVPVMPALVLCVATSEWVLPSASTTVACKRTLSRWQPGSDRL